VNETNGKFKTNPPNNIQAIFNDVTRSSELNGNFLGVLISFLLMGRAFSGVTNLGLSLLTFNPLLKQIPIIRNDLMKHLYTTSVTLTLINVLMLTACAPVQPWERGNLAKPQMALDPYPLQSALRAHNYGSREAAAGGNAAQGGGCGCY
jgi:Domain of unknown function (DUF4266)